MTRKFTVFKNETKCSKEAAVPGRKKIWFSTLAKITLITLWGLQVFKTLENSRFAFGNDKDH